MIIHSMQSGATTSVTVTRVAGEHAESSPDVLAVEEPLEIRLGFWVGGQQAYKSVSVTMRTPGCEDELAAGFLFSEGIVRSATQIQSVEPWGPLSSDGRWRNIIKVDLAPDVDVDLRRLERHFYTSSSCGVCGKASLDAVRASACLARIESLTRIPINLLHDLPRRLQLAQCDFALTGGLHGAALFSSEGDLKVVREDVGRHNAVDKALGHELLANRVMGSSVLMLSGRAGFELVQKAVVAGIPIVAAVGAPSSLSVELAEEFGMTLVGFLRNSKCNVYCGAERISGLS
jgi:FdhD protein